MKINSKVVSNNLCTSCGLCTHNNLAEMKLKKGIYIPFFSDNLSSSEDEFLYEICPGKGYPIVKIGKELYNSKETLYDYRLGYYREIGVATSKKSSLLEKSSSGAMIPEIALYLLKNNIVDGIVTVKFKYTADGPIPEPFIAKNKEDIISSQGSKYLPVPLLQIIDKIKLFKGNLAVIGTPCQIAGLKQIQEKDKILKNKIKFTISNFCGGYRDYRETERIFKISKIEKSKINYFSYRGNGQPGTMTIKQENKKPIHHKYPDYSRLTGYIKYNRCRLCVDATAELADISFGDAWLPRFLNTDNKWSAYIVRSSKMQDILLDMKTKELAIFDTISKEELLKSQQGNINTKKERQNSRYKFYKLINKKIPEFDGGFNTNETNLILELKVFIMHNLMFLLEKIRLYLPIAKLLKRI